MSTTNKAAPHVQETSKTLNLTILTGQDANFNESKIMAESKGGRLLETGDFELLSKNQIRDIKNATRKYGSLYLGDTLGAALKAKLKKTFGGVVNIFEPLESARRLTLGDDARNGETDVSTDLTFERVNIVAIVSLKEESKDETTKVENGFKYMRS